METRFLGEPVTVEFDVEPTLSKSPTCPQRILRPGQTLAIVAVLEEWRDYRRTGRMRANMQADHALLASQRGSWGVGRFFFRVRVEDGRIFDLYYDRAPTGHAGRAGSWHLYRELLS